MPTFCFGKGRFRTIPDDFAIEIEILESGLRDMEIWVDGKKMDENLMNTYSYYSSIQDSIPLSNGQHEVTVVSVGWDYSRVRTGFYLLVGSDTCAVPNGATLQVCSPMSDTTLTSPVLAYAAGAPVSGATIVRMEVWVDGAKMYSSLDKYLPRQGSRCRSGYVYNRPFPLWSGLNGYGEAPVKRTIESSRLLARV
jgi:hypothetical protein